ncbi:Rhodanese-related sulfurtransferase [Candidatus Magnetomorum sp. HK-1]|nr:Rhodanese-related sulfurtransferase [Candidatus Magnetomorum sp. HK-1]
MFFFNRIFHSLAFLLIIFVIASNVMAEEKLPCKDISAPEVKNLLDHGKALAVHVLSSFEYDIQHISNSINIPVNKIEKQQDKLPKEKSFPIIFYCMGHR